MNKAIDDILSRLINVKKSGTGWLACCPAHDDTDPSLSINTGEDGKALLHCLSQKCSTSSICSAIGLQLKDLFPDQPKSAHESIRRKVVKTYNYLDEGGGLLFQVCRTEPKGFFQRRPDGNGGWINNLKGVRLVPYRLKQLSAKPNGLAVITEGEKDADAAASHFGVLATTAPMGASKWLEQYNDYFLGRSVVIIPDNDDAGRKHATQVANSLSGKAKSIKVVSLPDLPSKGDLSDWIDRGGTKEQLKKLAEETAEWQSDSSSEAKSLPDAKRKPISIERALYSPFPTELLPSPVSDFIQFAGKSINCDEGFVALPLLAALASAVGNSRRIRIKRQWAEPCVIWAVIVGESGTGKSPAMDVALAPLRRLQAELFKEHERALERFEMDGYIFESDLGRWRKSGRGKGEPPPTEPKAPICRRLILEDATVEAAVYVMRGQPRGVLMSRDELSGWLNSFDAYKQSRGADVAHWLSFHRAGQCLFDRKTGKAPIIFVPRAAVSVCGGVQPKTLAKALAGRYQQNDESKGDKSPPREHFENGLAARLLLAKPPRVPKQWTEADIPEFATLAMSQVFDLLFSLDMQQDDSGVMQPIDIPLSSDARQAFIHYYNENAVEQCSLQSDLAAAWSKLEGYAARFALLIWLIKQVVGDVSVLGSIEVDLASMEAGIELSRWFGDEAARVYAELGGEKDSESAKDRREKDRLVSWIAIRGGRITVRDLTRGPRLYRSIDVAERCLQGLVDLKRGRWEHSAAESPGRPTRTFVLEVDRQDQIREPTGDETISDVADNAVSSPSPPESHDDTTMATPERATAEPPSAAGDKSTLDTDRNGFMSPSPQEYAMNSDFEHSTQSNPSDIPDSHLSGDETIAKHEEQGISSPSPLEEVEILTPMEPFDEEDEEDDDDGSGLFDEHGWEYHYREDFENEEVYDYEFAFGKDGRHLLNDEGCLLRRRRLKSPIS